MAAARQWHYDSDAAGLRVRPAAMVDIAVLLESLPLPTLILAGDGTAMAANRAWAARAADGAGATGGGDWLSRLAPLERAHLEAELRAAAQVGRAGSADLQRTGTGPGRRSRWWWGPGPAGQLVVCVADLDDGPPLPPTAEPGTSGEDAESKLDILGLLVNRLFGIGLTIQSAACLAGGPVQDRLELAVMELDDLIRETRSLVFGAVKPTPGQ